MALPSRLCFRYFFDVYFFSYFDISILKTFVLYLATSLLKVGEFSWDKTTQGRILGSFFVGYICTQFIGGFLSTRFGCKRVFGLAILLSAFLTILTPAAARTHVYFLIGVRFLVGFCQGVTYPAQLSLFAKWYPPLDRSRFGSICIGATYIGYVIAFPVAGLLCDYGFDGGWPSIFYVFGICGILWFIAWMYFMYDSPFLHPRISDAEKAYITEHQGEKESANRKVVPWLKLLTSTPVWAFVFCHICCTWGEYTFVTNIPSYMKEVLHFDIKTNGFLSALPYIGVSLWASISGNVADCLRRRNILNTDKVRKLFTTMGCLLPASFVIGLGFMNCTDSTYAVTLLTLSITMAGFQHGGGFMINPLDIAPSYAAIIVGISNTFATLPGFISPITVSELTQNCIDLSNPSLHPLPCELLSSDFNFSPCGHVITGDLSIVKNDKLREMLKKGPKYRESMSFTWNQNVKIIMDSCKEYARRRAKKEDVQLDALSEWITFIRGLLLSRVYRLKSNVNMRFESIFKDPDVITELAYLQEYYAITPADKAS
ncbi:hypothetical protein FSP39_022938 [Pinctada imbricata]|uniref:Major facilitator superfamily (MFS) profile domain-containing protein n=1 Tax=Pinctada imbricata TaxID=66713 RepID=A0AA88YBL8_PINIB|nr:hypothetical protein FSP39_022938 [Pinctada imbricata]